MSTPRNLSNLAPGASTVGVVSPAYGGTGVTSLTANNVILGNGAGNVQFVAPGTTGNVLTSNGTTWASSPAAGGGGGGSWIYLSTVTAAAASTADIETTFSSTYDNYVIVASNIYCVDPVSLNALLKVGGTYQTSSYRWAHFYDFRNLGSVGDGSGSANLITLSPGQAGGSSSTSNFVIYVWNAPLTTQHKLITWTGNVTTDIITIHGAGAWVNGTSALTGVRFQPTSGNFTGTFRLYGIKNS